MVDNLDISIMDILKKDSRCPFVDIGKKLNVSEGTVRVRVRKLVEDGTISGFTIKTCSKNVKAIVELRVDVNADTEKIAKTIATFEGITDVLEVTGDQDIVAFIDVDSTKNLNETIDKLRQHSGIVSTRTRTILKEHIGGNN